MNRTTLFGLMLGVTTLAACSGDEGTGPSAPTPPPPPPSTSTGTVNVRNDASVAILRVYISGCDEASWGANRLNSGEEIAPGALRSFTMPTGCYDVKVNTATKSGSWYDRMLTAGGAINLALPASANPSAGTVEDSPQSGWKSR